MSIKDFCIAIYKSVKSYIEWTPKLVLILQSLYFLIVLLFILIVLRSLF
jgi:hypothetical protein